MTAPRTNHAPRRARRHRRILAWGAAVAALALPACAGGDDGPPHPELTLETESYDLGSLTPGDRRTATLDVRNTGREPLVVDLVRTGIPALTASVSPARIEPGEEGRLTMRFRSNSWDEEESFDTAVVVYSNDPESPAVRLPVTGDLEAPISWNPKVPALRPFAPGDEPRELTRIEAKEGAGPLGPLRVESFLAFADAAAVADGPDAYRIMLTLTPDAPLGPLAGWVRVETTHADLPEIDIPVRTQVLGNLRLDRVAASFGIMDPGAPAEAAATLFVRPEHEVDVLRVEPHLPVPATVEFAREGDAWNVTARIAAPPDAWELDGHLNVFTDDPRQPVVQVPVEGWTRRADPFALAAAEGSDEGLYSLFEASLWQDETEVTAGDIVERVLDGNRDERAAALALRALDDDDDWYVRQRGADVLGALEREDTAPRLREALRGDEQSEVRRAALGALVRVAGKAAVGDLLVALNDDDSWIREDAARALGGLGDRRAVEPLTVLAREDEEPDVQRAARESLEKLDAAPSPSTNR